MKKTFFIFACCSSCAFLPLVVGRKPPVFRDVLPLTGNPQKIFLFCFNRQLSQNSHFGKTNAKGGFTLALINTKRKGAIPGEYVVYISWVEPEPRNAVEGVTKEMPIPYKIPTRASNGGMTFTVTEKGTTEANFDFDTSKESYKPSGV